MDESPQSQNPNQQPETEHLIASLWAPNQDGTSPTVHAILDCARDRSIEPMVNNSGLEHRCLYSDVKSYELKNAAPHVVTLEPYHEFTRKLLSRGWGQRWGIFAISYPPTTLIKVRALCKRIAKVQGPTGQRLILRYYDPGVMRHLLPACNRGELEQLFGPLVEFVLEGNCPMELQRFRWLKDTNELRIETYNLQQSAASTPQHIQTLTPSPASAPKGLLFKLRPEHMAVFTQQARQRDFAEIRQIVTSWLFADEKALREQRYTLAGKAVDAPTFMRYCFNKTPEFSLDTLYSVALFIKLCCQYGWEFWLRTEYAWVQAKLTASHDSNFKMEDIDQRLSRQLMDQLWS